MSKEVFLGFLIIIAVLAGALGALYGIFLLCAVAGAFQVWLFIGVCLAILGVTFLVLRHLGNKVQRAVEGFLDSVCCDGGN